MIVLDAFLNDIKLLMPTVHNDSRGYFMESYSRSTFSSLGITSEFVQDNQSYTAKKGTLRGIHFQNSPMAQAKLIRIMHGAVLDVAVDLRKNSPTYLKWISTVLNADNKHMLYIPRGYGHGFVSLTDDVVFLYKVDNYYSKEYDRGIIYNDPTIAIDWKISNPILSPKDLKAPLLQNCDCNFVFGNI